MWKRLGIVVERQRENTARMREQNIKNVGREVGVVPGKETCCPGEDKQQALGFVGQVIA